MASALLAIKYLKDTVQTSSLDDKSVLREDASLLLVTLNTTTKIGASLQIKIVYQSIYKEEFIAESKPFKI